MTATALTASPRLYALPSDPEQRDGDWAPDDPGTGPWPLDRAYAYCESIARERSSNFAVASRFVPAELRPDVWAIYAFARLADDFADEARYEGQRIEALDRWEELLDQSYRREVDHPVFRALRATVRRHDIPLSDLKALLTAYRFDLQGRHPRTYKDLRDYCSFAANPIGRIALYVHGHRESRLHRFSDDLAMGVQLAHHLQKLASDVAAGRHYLPLEDLVHFGVTREELERGESGEAFKELMAFSVARARTLLLRGKPLIRRVDPSLSMELEATWRGGMKILDRIEANDYDVFDNDAGLATRDLADVALRSAFSFGRRFFRGQ